MLKAVLIPSIEKVFLDTKMSTLEPLRSANVYRGSDFSFQIALTETTCDAAHRRFVGLSFDGIDQRCGNSNGRPHESADEVCDLDTRTVSMNIGGAYPDEAGVVSFIRTSHLEDGKITITDDIKLDSEKMIELHLTSHAEPKPLGRGRVELADGRVLSYNEELELVIEKIENTKPFEDLHFQSKWGTECLWRICLRIRATEYLATLVIE